MNSLFGVLLFCFYPFLQITAQDNPLAGCPKSPNCFRSELNIKRVAKQPLPFKGEMTDSQNQLIEILKAYPGANFESRSSATISFSFTTRLGKFTDDVVFHFDGKNKLIHFRSSSRVGWSDIGANKRRMKKIRKMWTNR